MRLLIIALALIMASCTNTTVPEPIEDVKLDTSHVVKAPYEAVGSANKYTTATVALEHANDGRIYYFEYATVVLGEKIYETASTSIPVRGNGSWISLSFDGGYTWSAVKVDDEGLIVAIQ
jgi:hypothetical protein